MTKLTGSARVTTKNEFIFTHFMLLRTQEAQLKKGFHNRYDNNNMTYQKWLLTK